MKRFLINLEDDTTDLNDIIKAFELTTKLMKEFGLSKVFLLVPTLQDMKDTSIEDFFGESIANSLLKDKIVQFKEFKLQLETIRTFRTPKAAKSILIAIYATDKMFDILNDVKIAEAIITVPWTMDQAEKWIKTWGPELI